MSGNRSHWIYILFTDSFWLTFAYYINLKMPRVPPLPFCKYQIFSRETHWRDFKTKRANKQKLRRFKDPAELWRKGEESFVKQGWLTDYRSVSAIVIIHTIISVSSVFFLRKLLRQPDGSMCVCLFHAIRETNSRLERGGICEVGHLRLKGRLVVEELIWLKKLQGD